MSQDMYAGYFGLSKRPFALVPDPNFLFWSPQHTRAFAVLEFGVMSRAPITLVTGEVGAGKTTLLHALLGRMTEEIRVGLISNAQGDRGELLQWAMNALGMELFEGESYVQMFRRLQDQLVADYAAGKRVILIFDEAQNLSKRGLEELRMFTNINSNQDELLQIILVGQPELRNVIRAPDMRQLAQRVAASFHLEGLDAPGTAGFIAHRLQHVGGTGEEFSPEAMELVHEATMGIPRLVNQLCDLAMLYAWSDEEQVVSNSTVQRVLEDGVFFGGGALQGETV
ncbi:ExeA family protein [Aliiruegeria sabulilitoris]|uniref:ExeA family protein n=1 Tax=Aliiruegeria sabulilitoris TaxID=1510458 RepID=UPI0008377888|nr:AAA family ATPase [Aliiruegeria sabulilitoris]NDR57070.1 AAA family ATPase [Pseudoruegeria sp. M32A2M]